MPIHLHFPRTDIGVMLTPRSTKLSEPTVTPGYAFKISSAAVPGIWPFGLLARLLLHVAVVKSVSVGNSPPSEARSHVQLSALLFPHEHVDPVTLAFSVAARSQVHWPAGRAPIIKLY